MTERTVFVVATGGDAKRARRQRLARAEQMLRAVQWGLSEEREISARLRMELMNAEACLAAMKQRERREEGTR